MACGCACRSSCARRRGTWSSPTRWSEKPAYEGLSFRQRRVLHAQAAEAIEARAKGTDSRRRAALAALAGRRTLGPSLGMRPLGRRAGFVSLRAMPTRPRSSVGRSTPPLICAESPKRSWRGVGELLGDVCELAGNYERARAAYGDAHRRLHQGAGRARLLRKVGVLQERRGRYPQALRNYTSALRHLDGDDDADLVERCELTLATAGVRHRQGRLRQSAAEAAVAGEYAVRSGYCHGLAHALYLRHINSVYLDEPDDALADEALAIFVELGDLVGQGNVLNNLGISAHYRGAWPEALEHYRASQAARERSGDLVGAATEDNNIGEILSDQGHYVEAERCFNAAKSTWRAARYSIGEALAASNLGRLAARTGRTLRGAALLAEARAAFEAIHAGSYVDETDVRLTECTLLAGELHRAAAAAANLTSRFLGRRDRERLYGAALRLRAVALAELGDLVEAGVLLDESVILLRTIAEGFELAQALAARAELTRRLGVGETSGRPACDGDEGDEADERDEADAQALFDRLGVVARRPW